MSSELQRKMGNFKRRQLREAFPSVLSLCSFSSHGSTFELYDKQHIPTLQLSRSDSHICDIAIISHILALVWFSYVPTLEDSRPPRALVGQTTSSDSIRSDSM